MYHNRCPISDYRLKTEVTEMNLSIFLLQLFGGFEPNNEYIHSELSFRDLKCRIDHIVYSSGPLKPEVIYFKPFVLYRPYIH